MHLHPNLQSKTTGRGADYCQRAAYVRLFDFKVSNKKIKRGFCLQLKAQPRLLWTPLTILSWWEEVENGGEDGPEKGRSGRAGGHLNGCRLLQTTIGLLFTPVVIGCLCRGGEGTRSTVLAEKTELNNNYSCLSELLTSIDGSSPANSAYIPPGCVGVCGCRGDQVVVHITVEACLLCWGFLLNLTRQHIITGVV